MLRKFFTLKFGTISVEELFKTIFVLGLIPIILINIFYIVGNGDNLFDTFMYSVRTGGILFVILFLLFFTLISIAVWKMICELLFLIFKSLEVFIYKNR
ncbi:MAG: hypothetical protein ACYDG2_20420 [Ruminiclostridium sp.]